MQFHNHLLGEMEQLASLSPSRKGLVANSPSGGTGLTLNPKVKSLQAQGQDPTETSPNAKTPCMFFGKRDTGCSRRRKCPYSYSRDGVPEKPRVAETAHPQSTLQKIAQQRQIMQERGKARMV